MIACARPPAGLPLAIITEALWKRYNVIDVEINNWNTTNGKKDFMYKGFRAFIRFETLEEALNFPQDVIVEGHKIMALDNG